MRFHEGASRHQLQFFTKLDDLIDQKHYIRLIDLFVDSFLNEYISHFCKGDKAIGRKAYHPGYLLKLFIYSYLNGISSSRKIEKECHRNLEAMWLMCQLAPDHKTISDFRKENGEGIKLAFNKLNLLLKQQGYIKGQTLSIDGSKIRANASMSIDMEGISKKLDNLEDQLNDYLSRIEATDNLDGELEEKEKQKQQLDKEIELLKQQVNKLKQQKEELKRLGTKRLNTTDADARIMKSRQGKHFCYNMQASVDAENHFIASVNTVSNENDKGQLLPVAEQLKKELGLIPKELLADAGYYVVSQIETLEKQGIECYVAINHNQQHTRGVDFEYDEQNDKYVCSKGQELLPKNGLKRDNKRGTVTQAYIGINCKPCEIRTQCTFAEARTVYRHMDQERRNTYENKMISPLGKSKLIQRKILSEHVFGTLKYWMGQIPLKTRSLKKVSTEINLYSMCYNLKRLLNIETFDRLVALFKGGKLILS